MTIKFMNRMALDVLRNRLVMAFALVSCVSLFLVVNSAAIYAQSGSADMRTIPTFIGYEETFQWSDVPEILAEGVKNVTKDSKDAAYEYSWGSDLFFQKEIWQLQFSYKNIRTIDVNFPTKEGTLETKRVWYLVYSVTNTGKRLRAELDSDVTADVSQKVLKPAAKVGDAREEQVYQFPSNNLRGVYKPVEVNFKSGDAEGAVRFVPRFIYASSTIQERLDYKLGEDGLYRGQKRGAEEGVYYDAYLPLAIVQIAKREAREGVELIDSVRMATLSIQPGQTVWGVATWTDVDPRIDKFSVYISGLTNALRWEISSEPADPDNAQVGAGRDVMRKILKLNFYNPGDENHRGGKEIYNNLPGELDYQWIYM